MSKATNTGGPSPESLRALPEVDFSRLRRGQRGKYAHVMTGEAVRAVVIAADVWEHFGSAKAVNRALRMLVDVASKAKTKGRHPRTKARSAA